MTKINHNRDILRFIDEKKKMKLEQPAKPADKLAKERTCEEEVRFEIQECLVSLAHRWKETGDVRPVAKSVNLMLEEYSDSLSPADIIIWLKTYFDFDYSPESRAFEFGRKKPKHLNIVELRQNKWWAKK